MAEIANLGDFVLTSSVLIMANSRKIRRQPISLNLVKQKWVARDINAPVVEKPLSKPREQSSIDVGLPEKRSSRRSPNQTQLTFSPEITSFAPSYDLIDRVSRFTLQKP